MAKSSDLCKYSLLFQINVKYYSPEHEGSVKNGTLDPLGEFITTIGCDGTLHIYKFTQVGEDQRIEFIHKIKLFNKRTEAFGFHNCEMIWAQDGSSLLVSGDSKLKRIERGTWLSSDVQDIGHKGQEINCVAWLTDDILATAGLDNLIKVWDVKEKSLLYYITSSS